MSWLPAFPAMCCSALLGLFQLGQPSIWLDEGYTAEAVVRSWDGVTREIWWFHYAVVKAWTLVAGTSEFALRFPSVLGAVVAAALLYGLAMKLLGRRAALVASLLLALSPFVVKWSQQARGYTILLALAIASTWLLVRALERNTPVAWAGYGLLLVVMVHWHAFSALIFLPVHFVVAWRSRGALVTWGVSLLYSLPWLVDFLTRPEVDRPTSWIQSPRPQYVGEVLLEVPGAVVVGLVLAVVGAILVEQHRRLLLTWAALPFAISLVASLYDPVFQGRYLIVTCPAFAILGGVALVELTGGLRIAAVTATAAVTLVSLVIWYAPDGGDNWTGEDWRAATEVVMRDGGARIIPSWAEPAFRYYGGRRARNGWVLERRWQEGGFGGTRYETREFGDQLRAIRMATP